MTLGASFICPLCDPYSMYADWSKVDRQPMREELVVYHNEQEGMAVIINTAFVGDTSRVKFWYIIRKCRWKYRMILEVFGYRIDVSPTTKLANWHISRNNLHFPSLSRGFLLANNRIQWNFWCSCELCQLDIFRGKFGALMIYWKINLLMIVGYTKIL